VKIAAFLPLAEKKSFEINLRTACCELFSGIGRFTHPIFPGQDQHPLPQCCGRTLTSLVLGGAGMARAVEQIPGAQLTRLNSGLIYQA